MFFMNYIPKEFFIDNGCIQLAFDPRRDYWAGGGKNTKNAWYRTLNNVYDMEMKMHNNFGRLHLAFSHLPEICCSVLEKEWFKKDDNMEKTIKMFSKSRFRHVDNAILHWFFIHLLKFNCDKIPFRVSTGKYKRIKCDNCSCEKDQNFEKYRNAGIVCFNDSDLTPTEPVEFQKLKTRFLEFLESKFPEKSSFEL